MARKKTDISFNFGAVASSRKVFATKVKAPKKSRKKKPAGGGSQ